MIDSKEWRALRWRRGETPGPWRLFLFPTYRCNLECGYCSQALVEDPPELLKEISDERLLALIDEAAAMGVKEFLIGGGGEPMLRRKVVMGMIEKARAHGMLGTLQTNATGFRPEDLETLVRIGWQYMSVSVDGPSEETNDAIRYKNSFNRLKKNLGLIREFKEKYNATAPFVQLAVVVTSQNCDLLPDMVRFGHEMGVQRVHFLDLYTRHDGLEKYLIHPEHRAKIQAGAAVAALLAEEFGIETNARDFENQKPEGEPWVFPEARDEAELNLAHITESTCFEPWLSLSIQSSGNAGPCCTFWEGHSTNIKEHSLQEVWTGPYMTQMRKDMLLNRPPEPCRECHTDLIVHNRDVGVKVRALRAQEAMQAVTPAQLVAKAARSLQKNGIKNSLRRGKEWLTIRRTLAGK